MRAKEFISEVDRRGFLKGMLAGLGMGTGAGTWLANQPPDQNTVTEPIPVDTRPQQTQPQQTQPQQTQPQQHEWTAAAGKKLKEISASLGVDANDLLKIIWHETAGSMLPSNQSPRTRATGLIQFTPRTAASLRTSTEELANMTAERQLDFVLEYYRRIGIKPGSDMGDLYIATFLPKFANPKYNNSTVVAIDPGHKIGRLTADSLIAKGLTYGHVWTSNPAFRIKDKHFYTKGDVKKTLARRVSDMPDNITA